MDLRRIKTEADHRAAVAEIEALMGAEPGSEAFGQLERLAKLVDAYEAKTHPIAAPEPIDAILFHLEQLRDPRIQVSNYPNVSSKLKELGCSPPKGIGILPKRFDTLTSTDDFAQVSLTGPVVKLLKENKIPVSIIKRGGQTLPTSHTASSGWVAPTLLVSAALWLQNPEAVSLALGVVANYLADRFKGTKAELDIVLPEDGSRPCKKISYKGPVEGLKELPKIIKSANRPSR